MEPIFSRDAQVVGWLKHHVVYDDAGQPRAFLRGTAVLSLAAEYLGRFAFGFFRDVHGDAVAFVHGASGGPLTPAPRVIPEPPGMAEPRALAEPRVVAREATPTLFWSELDWAEFLTARPIEDLSSRALLIDEAPGLV